MSEKNYKSVSEAIKNGLGSLVSRLLIIFGIPLILSMGSYIGYQVVDEIAKLNRSLNRLGDKVENQHLNTLENLNKLDVRLTITETKLERDRERR